MEGNVVREYGWSTARPTCAHAFLTPEILQILKRFKSKRVLDLGAGNGALCDSMASAGYDVVGIDYDANGVAIAKKAHPSIPFYRFGVQDDPAGLLKHEELFDVVVSTEVVEHLFSPHLLPQFAAKVLRENGLLVISTPYHGYLKNLALAFFNAWDRHHTPLWHGGHIKFWSKRTLTQLLEEDRFKVIGFQGAGRVPFLWKSMILVARKID